MGGGGYKIPRLSVEKTGWEMQKEIEFDENIVRGEKAAISEFRKKVEVFKSENNKTLCFRDNKRKAADDDMAIEKNIRGEKRSKFCSRSKLDSAELVASSSSSSKEHLNLSPNSGSGVRTSSRSKLGSAKTGASLPNSTKERLKLSLTSRKELRTCSLSNLDSAETGASLSDSTKERLNSSLTGRKGLRTCSLSNLDSAKTGASLPSSTKERLSSKSRRRRPSRTCTKSIQLMNEWLNGGTRHVSKLLSHSKTSNLIEPTL